MNGLQIVALALQLVSTALANPWGGDGQCVQLRSVFTDMDLISSDYTHDADRRHVVVHMTKNQNWVIISDERYRGYYKLKHYRLGEVLFESVQSWNGNYIFTWIPKRIINDGGASWNITWVSHGVYILKNKKFGHCFWTKGAEDWVGAYGGCDHEEYQWKIRKLPCGVGES
ncbi:uncharacterized protein LOC120420281 [Culex pipiens pallens]|uniref:uncharacterized protein LOC120420281 n=1 Tax=Culex pipiens pallens TaxID=42434 RepID=UPI001952C452|nr:uncharacterized protein LOC120420281 [Culex pipiens pallens]